MSVLKITGRITGIVFFGTVYWTLFSVAQKLPPYEFFNITTFVGITMYVCATICHSAWDWWK